MRYGGGDRYCGCRAGPGGGICHRQVPCRSLLGTHVVDETSRPNCFWKYV
ncbi:MAG: hypothetical protein MZV64_36105 [Ignavibacteriales bacterium]|nr:hypothetical protein [Ignavibacteriales bacterium]